jgi:hypothetical protein
MTENINNNPRDYKSVCKNISANKPPSTNRKLPSTPFSKQAFLHYLEVSRACRAAPEAVDPRAIDIALDCAHYLFHRPKYSIANSYPEILFRIGATLPPYAQDYIDSGLRQFRRVEDHLASLDINPETGNPRSPCPKGECRDMNTCERSSCWGG